MYEYQGAYSGGSWIFKSSTTVLMYTYLAGAAGCDVAAAKLLLRACQKSELKGLVRYEILDFLPFHGIVWYEGLESNTF
jgi:hypothetical protein